MVRTQSAARKEQILEVSARLFAQRGYHRTSVADIIGAAGIARGTFYLYFRSKQQVFEVLLDRFLTELKDGIRRIDVTSDVPPVEQLLNNLHRAIDTVRRFRDVATLVLGPVEAPDSTIRARVDCFFNEVKELVTSSIQTGMELGLVRDVPADVATHFVFGAAKEVVRDMVALSDVTSLAAGERTSARDLSRTLVDLVAAGLFGSLVATGALDP